MKEEEIISEFYSDDKVCRAVVKYLNNTNQYAVDYYQSNKFCFSVLYNDKDLNYVEDAAETYVMGLFGNRRTNELRNSNIKQSPAE
jgi:hypothetical protein